jgi:pyruvate kinase
MITPHHTTPHHTAQVLATAAAILRDAEVGIDSYAKFNFIRNFTPKPMPTLETLCSSAVKSAIDMGAALLCVVTNTFAPVRTLTKYRPNQVCVCLFVVVVVVVAASLSLTWWRKQACAPPPLSLSLSSSGHCGVHHQASRGAAMQFGTPHAPAAAALHQDEPGTDP